MSVAAWRCSLLLEAPDLLLLDEPTNHLDAESVLWLEKFLHDYPGAVMAVTHDRYFLDDVAEWICEVDRGQLYPYEGNYSTYLENKAARLEAQNQQDAKRAKKMRAELDWVRSSPKARQQRTRTTDRYEQMEAEARASKKLDFTEIQIPVGPRLGQKSWTPVIYIRRLAIVCLSTIFPLAYRAMVSSVSLPLTAWESQRSLR